jgi:hypothetical protein
MTAQEALLSHYRNSVVIFARHEQLILAKRIKKLKEMPRDFLPPDEQKRLARQCGIMEQYSQVLKERIEASSI